MWRILKCQNGRLGFTYHIASCYFTISIRNLNLKLHSFPAVTFYFYNPAYFFPPYSICDLLSFFSVQTCLSLARRGSSTTRCPARRPSSALTKLSSSFPPPRFPFDANDPISLSSRAGADCTDHYKCFKASVIPDQAFHDFRATKSVDWCILCTSETTVRLWNLRNFGRGPALAAIAVRWIEICCLACWVDFKIVKKWLECLFSHDGKNVLRSVVRAKSLLLTLWANNFFQSLYIWIIIAIAVLYLASRMKICVHRLSQTQLID